MSTSMCKAGGDADGKKWFLFVGFAAVYAGKAINVDLKRGAYRKSDYIRSLVTAFVVVLESCGLF